MSATTRSGYLVGVNSADSLRNIYLFMNVVLVTMCLRMLLRTPKKASSSSGYPGQAGWTFRSNSNLPGPAAVSEDSGGAHPVLQTDTEEVLYD